MMFSREYESMDRQDMEQLQLERLQSTLNRVYKNEAAYKQILDEQKIDIEKLKSLDELEYLPFTTKDDLRKSYPYDAFAVPLRDIVRIHSTSGTTGKPIVVGYTKADLSNWASMIARVFTAAGISNHDFVQVAFSYNLSTAGLGFHYGAEKIGASVIPSSNEDIRRQLLIMRDYKSTALVSTPGYALHLGSVLQESGIHPDELFLNIGLFGSEPWSVNLRSQIEDSLHITAYDNYGLTEVIGPGVAFECAERDGLHINEDHFVVEVVDPKTLKPVPPGEKGELVFTTITKQGFPLIRYRTGDISALISGECKCGRTLQRMERVSGRNDDMIIVEGINVFPSQIEEVLLEVEGIEPHYQIVLDRNEGLDTMEIQVEVSKDLPLLDETRELQKFIQRIDTHLSVSLGFSPKITLVEPKSIQRSSGGKMKRVIDHREV
ncbi:MAG: phenylacetate--CoA ligase [Spirochaetales bacterium]|jgi:phenylacetate-CoA ligase|nr:phenylacetate--CoA ligase [Spirochaetales bacterium]